MATTRGSELVAIYDLGDVPTGRFPEEITAEPGAILVGNRMIKVCAECDPGDLRADIVIESWSSP